MSYLNIRTNQSLDFQQSENLLAEASQICAETLGKPEDFMMVSLEVLQSIFTGGSSESAAFLDLRSIGFPEGAQRVLSSKLCHFLKEKIKL